MTDQQDHRHQCEVRMLIAASRDPDRGRRWVRDYLADPKVVGRREQLRTDLNDQLSKSNDGSHGTWL